MKNFVEGGLRWRGMLAQMMQVLRKCFKKEMVSAYLGTDPTAGSLHIGHLYWYHDVCVICSVVDTSLTSLVGGTGYDW